MRPWLSTTDDDFGVPRVAAGVVASMRPWLSTTDDMMLTEVVMRWRSASMRPWLSTTDDGPRSKQAYHNNLLRYLRGVPLNDPTVRGEALPGVLGSNQLPDC